MNRLSGETMLNRRVGVVAPSLPSHEGVYEVRGSASHKSSPLVQAHHSCWEKQAHELGNTRCWKPDAKAEHHSQALAYRRSREERSCRCEGQCVSLGK